MTTGTDGAGSSSSRRRMHVVIFPWLAFGHLLPGLELAQRLASRGHRVSFVSTPRNLARLPPLPPALAPRVGLVALPLPRLEDGGLPDGAESTNDVPSGAFELLRKAFDGLAAPFAAFLDAACAQGVGNGRPDWVVVDNFHHWAAAAAVDRKVPCAMLLHVPASIFAALAGQPAAGTGQQQRASGDGQPAATAPRFETERNRNMYSTDGASGISVGQRFSLTAQCCDFIGIRTCAEFEPEALSLFSLPHPLRQAGRPLRPPAAVARRRPPRRRQERQRRRRCHHAVARRAAAGDGRVRGAGKRGAAEHRAGARAGSRAGARRGALPLGSEEARRRRGRGRPPPRIRGAHAWTWARRDGVGSADQHPGARRRGRVPDALRVELDDRGASVRASAHHAPDLWRPRVERAADGGAEGGSASGEG
ncbi:unnamed protein product [Urochloa humidicola]